MGSSIKDFGKIVQSWKRMATDYPMTEVIDNQLLWSVDGKTETDSLNGNERDLKFGSDCKGKTLHMSQSEYDLLTSNRAAHYLKMAKEKQQQQQP